MESSMAKRCPTTDSDFYWKLFLFSVVLFLGCSERFSSQEKATSDQVRARRETTRFMIRLVADEGTEKKEKEKKFDPPDRAIAAVEDEEPKKSAPVDFETRNGKIFSDWEKPQATIVFSGMLDGFIEPCGCAGLDNQKGGLSRRHSLIREIQSKGWPAISLDLGGMVQRAGPQAAIKYQRLIAAHQILGYEAIGLGAHDIKLPTEILLAQLPQDKPSPFVTANVVSIFDDDFGLTARFRVIDTGGLRIGVTQVLGEEYGDDLQNPDFQYQPPSEALPPVIKQLKAEKCDLLILLANASVAEARTMAEEFTTFDFVVVAGDSDPPPPQPEISKDTSTRLIELGHKGMYVGVLGIYEKPQRHFLYQRVPLDGRFSGSQEMVAMMAAYQDQLKEQGLAGLGIRAIGHPSGQQFVGSEACEECHTEEYAVWEDTSHAHAMETLLQLPIPRSFDPECISCHVTGWEPQEHYPFASGYESMAKTPHLAGVGCENCHGGGAKHVAAENELSDEAELEQRRVEMRLTLEQAKNHACANCHDLDNSPSFEFDKYWSEVEH
jgi:hypothetical protein